MSEQDKKPATPAPTPLPPPPPEINDSDSDSSEDDDNNDDNNIFGRPLSFVEKAVLMYFAQLGRARGGHWIFGMPSPNTLRRAVAIATAAHERGNGEVVAAARNAAAAAEEANVALKESIAICDSILEDTEANDAASTAAKWQQLTDVTGVAVDKAKKAVAATKEAAVLAGESEASVDESVPTMLEVANLATAAIAFATAATERMSDPKERKEN